MDKFDFELIEKEMKQQEEIKYKNTTITKSLIDKCLNDYNRCAYSVLFYDSEPDIDYEEWKKLQETEEGKLKYEQMVKEYEPKRKSFNNWVDPYDEGIWGFTNNYVKELARNLLNKLKKDTYQDKRFYLIENRDCIKLYYYGRDNECQCDYWFTFWNEENRNSKCDKCNYDICWRECKGI